MTRRRVEPLVLGIAAAAAGALLEVWLRAATRFGCSCGCEDAAP